MSTPRQPYAHLSADAMRGLVATKAALERGPVGAPLLELVYLRISQINGCAYCLELHTQALRQRGEEQARLDALAGWRVSGRFSERERAALDWAESLTRIAETQAPDAVYHPLEAHFSPAQITDLSIAVALMNAFNRLAVGMRQ